MINQPENYKIRLMLMLITVIVVCLMTMSCSLLTQPEKVQLLPQPLVLPPSLNVPCEVPVARRNNRAGSIAETLKVLYVRFPRVVYSIRRKYCNEYA